MIVLLCFLNDETIERITEMNALVTTVAISRLFVSCVRVVCLVLCGMKNAGAEWYVCVCVE